MPNTAIILWALLFGSIGVGYFIYGKRQGQPVVRYTGIALILFPYFVREELAMILVGISLLLLPYVIKRFF
ncbi:MAG: hypothetical protein V7745_07530 [Pseudomonadales bacterium]